MTLTAVQLYQNKKQPPKEHYHPNTLSRSLPRKWKRKEKKKEKNI